MHSRQCEVSQDIVDNYRTMFESRISAGGLEKLLFPQNLRISSWSYDMVGHAKKCVERYCELANKSTPPLYKVSTFMHRWPPLQGRRNEICWRIVTSVLSLIVLKYLARIGRPDVLWSVNKLARSITKWTEACDKRLNRLISYIHCEYKQYVYVGTEQCRMGLFQDSDFAGEILRTQNLLRVEQCAFSEVIHLFQSVGCVRNKLLFRTVEQNQKSFLWTQD